MIKNNQRENDTTVLVVKSSQKQIRNKSCKKKMIDVIEDQFEDLDLSQPQNDYLMVAVHYKALCKMYKKQLSETSKKLSDLERRLNESVANDQMVLASAVDKESSQMRAFGAQFLDLIKQINPNLISNTTANSDNDLACLSQVCEQALRYVNENSLSKYHCKCNQYDCLALNKPTNHNRKHLASAGSTCSSTNSYSSSSSSSTSSLMLSRPSLFSLAGSSRHAPSAEYLLDCVNLFQNLFDVDCFVNVPTKLNELYYKHGQMQNFRNVVQNLIDPNANYTIEKLICSVKLMHKRANNELANDLKAKLMRAEDLENIVNKFNTYDEYFPIFFKLLDEIMKSLEISRLDQIMPAIKALKILSTPTS